MDINIKINKSTRTVDCDKRYIGLDGENLQSNLLFCFEDEFVDGEARLEYEMNDEKAYIPLTKENETYSIPIKSVLTKNGEIDLQLVITEPKSNNEIPVFKSEKFRVVVGNSINAVGEAPDEYNLWIDVINAKLLEMDNINIDADKIGKITSIIITHKDGTAKEVQLEDGMGLDYIWQGTSLGIKREDETEYRFANLQGEKGEPGAIKMQIVAELPQTGSDDTIYLVPIPIIEVSELPQIGQPNTIYVIIETGKRYVYENNQWRETTNKNNFNEYIYLNNKWEQLGGIQVQVDLTDYYTKQETYSKGEVDNLISDLTDYVKNTDYATSLKGGVIKTSNYYDTEIDSSGALRSKVVSYAGYPNESNNAFISKGTLDNVLNAKIGDIDSVLDTINGEVI